MRSRTRAATTSSRSFWRCSGPASCASALTVGRRLIAGRVSLDVEYDLRQTFYEHLQKLELGFFDTQQTGQLMSRATVDLQSIRFFLGYGLIWVSQSFLTIAFAAVAMFVIDPFLAALALAPVPFLIATATRYSRRNRPAEQEVQQRVGRGHRERRGERLGDPHRQGVRARGLHDGPLPAGPSIASSTRA